MLQEMDSELERYNRNNAAQDLTLSDLRMRHSGAQEALARERAAVQASQLHQSEGRPCFSLPSHAKACYGSHDSFCIAELYQTQWCTCCFIGW